VLFFKKSKKIVRLKDVIPEGEEFIMRYKTVDNRELFKLFIGLICSGFIFIFSSINLFLSIIDATKFDRHLFIGYIIWTVLSAFTIFLIIDKKRNNIVYLTKHYLILQNGERYPLKQLWFCPRKIYTRRVIHYVLFLIYKNGNSDTIIFDSDIKTDKYDNFIKALHNVSGNDLILFCLKDDFKNALSDFGTRKIKLID